MDDVPLVSPAIDKAEQLADENADSTNSNLRYAAYGARLQTVIRAGHRYIAYTSDIGEAFRPIVSPRMVSAAYGLSWLYLGGDVAFESYKAYRRGPSPLEATHFSEPTRVGMVAVKRAAFQSIASMALPAFTIHTAVKQAKKAFANAANPRVKAWGPTVTGLAIVPVLPYLFDHPVETVTDRIFEFVEESVTGVPTEHKKTEL